MFMTTVRVRKARKDTLQDTGVDPAKCEGTLVELMVAGEPRVIAAVVDDDEQPTTTDSITLVWWQTSWDDYRDDLRTLIATAINVAHIVAPHTPAA